MSACASAVQIGWRLRPAGPGDADFLLALFNQARARDFDLLPLDAAGKALLVRMQCDAQERHYRACYPGARFEVMEAGGKAVGRVVVHRDGERLLLVDIALATAWRGQGLGGQVIGALMAEAAVDGLPVRLHVRHDNPARGLYRRLGFRETGDRGADLEMQWVPGQVVG